MKLPEEYTEKMKLLLKDEFEDYLKSLENKRYCGLRVNTLKAEPEEIRHRLEFETENVSWCREGFYFPEEVRPAKHPYYYAGLYYIQEPSAMSTGAMINIKPGDRVLDLCAAPGGKSTQAAAKLKNKGVLVSNDISASRCKALLKNIEICGVTNAVITNEMPERLAERFEGFFNRIIVDAPCSGEGMFRKDSEAVKNWDKHKSDFCRSLQREILAAADKLLCDGGIIAYSTCTFSPEENEGMLAEFMNKYNNYELLEVDKSLGFDSGRPEWTESGSAELRKCGRLWPHKIKGEGHFLALLRKKGEEKEISANRADNVDIGRLTDYFKFMKENMNIEINDELEIHGNSLMKIPSGIDLRGLRVVRSGLYIGDIKKNRFEPSQAFAMGLKKEDVKNVIDFDLKDERVLRYLKGESFNANGNDGWNLVCVDGFPLGWGKMQNGRLKNKYLRGWRI